MLHATGSEIKEPPPSQYFMRNPAVVCIALQLQLLLLVAGTKAEEDHHIHYVGCLPYNQSTFPAPAVVTTGPAPDVRTCARTCTAKDQHYALWQAGTESCACLSSPPANLAARTSCEAWGSMRVYNLQSPGIASTSQRLLRVGHQPFITQTSHSYFSQQRSHRYLSQEERHGAASVICRAFTGSLESECRVHWYSWEGHSDGTVSLKVEIKTYDEPFRVLPNTMTELGTLCAMSNNCTFKIKCIMAYGSCNVDFVIMRANNIVNGVYPPLRVGDVSIKESDLVSGGSISTEYPLYVRCQDPLRYGARCTKKQKLDSSIVVGWLTVALSLLGILILWSDWPRVWADWLKHHVTAKFVALLRKWAPSSSPGSSTSDESNANATANANASAILNDSGVLLMWLGLIMLLYLIDVLMVAASSLLILRGLRRDVKAFFVSLMDSFKRAFPEVLHLYFNAVHLLFIWVDRIAAKLAILKLISSGLQVTCEGAQAPTQALLDVLFGVALFILFASGFLVATKATLDTFTKMKAEERQRKPHGLVLGMIMTTYGLLQSYAAKGVESTLFYSVQILFSSLTITDFVNDGNGHPYTHMVMGTLMFALAFFPMAHVCLKCVVPGLPDKASFSPRTYKGSQMAATRGTGLKAFFLSWVCGLPSSLLGLLGVPTSPEWMEKPTLFSSLETARGEAEGGAEGGAKGRLCMSVGVFGFLWGLFDLVAISAVLLSWAIALSRLLFSGRTWYRLWFKVVYHGGIAVTPVICYGYLGLVVLLFYLRKPRQVDADMHYVRVPVRWILSWTAYFVRCVVVSYLIALPCVWAMKDYMHLGFKGYRSLESEERFKLGVVTVVVAVNVMSLWWLSTLLYEWGGFPFKPVHLSKCLRKVMGLKQEHLDDATPDVEAGQEEVKDATALEEDQEEGKDDNPPIPAPLPSPLHLPRPWPSVRAVFEMALVHDTNQPENENNTITWEDMVTVHDMLVNGTWTAGLTQEDLETHWLWVLIEMCNRDADFRDRAKEAYEKHSSRSRMDLEAFRRFVEALTLKHDVPTLIELLYLMATDWSRAWASWRQDAEAQERWHCCSFSYLLHTWWSLTPRTYLLAMAWKLKQLVKLTLGWWDRETVRTFGIAELADELRLGPKPGLMDMTVIGAIGTTRVLAWQAAPLLVTFSKLGQAIGDGPLYISDDLVATEVCFRRKLVNGVPTPEGRPVLEEIKPFAPQGWYSCDWKVKKVARVGGGILGLEKESVNWFEAFKKTRVLNLYVSCLRFGLTILAVALLHKSSSDSKTSLDSKTMLHHAPALFYAYLGLTFVPRCIQAAIKLDGLGLELKRLPACCPR